MRASTIVSLTAIVAMGLVTAGCTRLRGHQGYIGDEVLLKSVAPGVDNKASVQTSLGRPTFTGQFSDNDWYYYSRETKALAFTQPKPSSQFVLHVKFDPSGNVAAVNQTGLETNSRISPEGDKTPTLGRHTSFFEELFGNIGTVGAPGTGGGGGGDGP